MIGYGRDYTCRHGLSWGEDACREPSDTSSDPNNDQAAGGGTPVGTGGEAGQAPHGSGGDGFEDGDGGWTPVDLAPYLDGTHQQPEPTLGLCRADGLRLLYPGKEHSVIGEMESGKGWFAAACAAAEIDAGRSVVYAHFEESDAADVTGRLLALGVDRGAIGRLLRYVAPTGPVTTSLLALLLLPDPGDPTGLASLVILDGVNEAMAMHGKAIREEDGVAAFRRQLVKPCTRAGAAVLMCDHVVKDKEARGRYALGSIHKGNALSGASFALENREPFGRGMRGASHLFVVKDRPGFLRRHGHATTTPGRTFLGTLVVDDTRERMSYLDLALLPKNDSEPTPGATATLLADPADNLCAATTGWIAEHGPVEVRSKDQLFGWLRKRGAAGRTATVVRPAVAALEEAGWWQPAPRGGGRLAPPSGWVQPPTEE